MATHTINLTTGWNTFAIQEGGGGTRLSNISITSAALVSLDAVGVGRFNPWSDSSVAQEAMFYQTGVVVPTDAVGFTESLPAGRGLSTRSPNHGPVSIGINAPYDVTVVVTVNFERGGAGQHDALTDLIPAIEDLSPGGLEISRSLTMIDLLRKLVNELRINNQYLSKVTGESLSLCDIQEEE